MKTSGQWAVIGLCGVGLLLSGSALAFALQPHHLPKKEAALQTIGAGMPGTEIAVENANGGKTTLSQFQGRVTVLIIAGKDSADAGMALLRDVTLSTAQEQSVSYVLTADLRSAPGFFRGQIRDKVKDRMKSQRNETAVAFKRAGRAFEPRHNPAVLLDWQGRMAKQFAVRQNLDNAYQVVVLDKKGHVVFQCTQPDARKGGPPPTAQVIRAIQDTLAGK